MQNIRELILNLDGFMGDVARGTNNGLSFDKIAENAGHKNTMITFVFLKAIKLLTGKFDYNDPNVKYESKKHAYYKARKWSSLPTITESEKAHLQSLVELFESEYNKEDKPTDSHKNNNKPFSPLPKKPGVYVYSYSLYLNNPVSPIDNRTLFKVGASSVDIVDRIEAQSSKTPVPDDMQLLRIFECGDAIKEEKKFHRILTAAGHYHDTNSGGTEWFLTKLELIDAIAESLGLFNSIVNNERY